MVSAGTRAGLSFGECLDGLSSDRRTKASLLPESCPAASARRCWTCWWISVRSSAKTRHASSLFATIASEQTCRILSSRRRESTYKLCISESSRQEYGGTCMRRMASRRSAINWGHCIATIPQLSKWETMPNSASKLFPICSICNEPVELETKKTNELGKAVHEECYVLHLQLIRASTPPRSPSS